MEVAKRTKRDRMGIGKKNLKRMGKKKLVGIVATVLVVALLLIYGLPALFHMRRSGLNAAASTSRSATAVVGTINSTVSGTGNIEMNQTDDVVVPKGILVKKVLVDSGDTVTKGETLAKLDKTSIAEKLLQAKEELADVNDTLDDSGLSDLKIETLKGEKSELKDAISTLKSLHSNLVIQATSAGVIQDVNVSEDTETSQTSTGSTTSTSGSTATSGTSAKATETGSDQSDGAEVSLLSAQLTNATATDLTTAKTVTDYSHLTITAPVKGVVPQSKITETAGYSGDITWNCTGTVFQPDTVYTATIVLTAKDGYVFKSGSLPVIACSTYDWRILDENTEGNQLRIVATFEKTASNTTGSGGKTASSSRQSSGTTGRTQSSQRVSTSSGTTGSTRVSSGSTSSGTTTGGTTTSGSTSSDTTTTASSDDTTSTYNSEATAFTIQSQDDVSVSVSIDELDILSVKKDQKATVTLDAMDGKKFTGTISKIAADADTGSGSAKYTVEVAMAKNDQMKSGMSASVVIVTGSAKNAVLIPVDALQEKGSEKFVYTKQAKDGTLSGKVDVETGLSDSSNVVITKGLKKGETVYYTKADTEESSSSSNTNSLFGKQSGTMPSGQGENMPSGQGWSRRESK